MKLRIDSNVTKVFATGDTHFGHKNIIQYCERPFADVADMQTKMVDDWNAKIGPEDVVFHVGDFAFMKDASSVAEQLNGKIILIPGNHDRGRFVKGSRFMEISSDPTLARFNVAPQILEVTIRVEDEKIPFVFCHYAMRVWNKSHFGAIHLYGHSHGSLPDDPNSRSMDVGVDTHPGYVPYSLDEILVHMYKKSFVPKDHHDGNR